MTVLCSVPVHCFGKIQYYGAIAFRECIALYATTLGCGKFYIDVVIGKAHLIITCVGSLIVVRETGVYAERCIGLTHRKHNRQE